MNTGVGGHVTFLEVLAFHDNGWGGKNQTLNLIAMQAVPINFKSDEIVA